MHVKLQIKDRIVIDQREMRCKYEHRPYSKRKLIIYKNKRQ